MRGFIDLFHLSNANAFIHKDSYVHIQHTGEEIDIHTDNRHFDNKRMRNFQGHLDSHIRFQRLCNDLFLWKDKVNWNVDWYVKIMMKWNTWQIRHFAPSCLYPWLWKRGSESFLLYLSVSPSKTYKSEIWIA